MMEEYMGHARMTGKRVESKIGVGRERRKSLSNEAET